MSSVRVPNSLRRPGSLRRPAVVPASTASSRPEVSKTSLFTAACLAAASPASIALAQTTGQEPLPPLSVEAKAAKKKAPATATKSGGTAAAPVRHRRTGADTRSEDGQPLCRSGGALQGRPIRLRQIDTTARQYTEDGNGASEGGDRGQGRTRSARARPFGSGLDHRLGRRRKCLWSLCDPRLQGQQRYLRRQHPQSGQSHPRCIFRRAGGDLQGPERRYRWTQHDRRRGQCHFQAAEF